MSQDPEYQEKREQLIEDSQDTFKELERQQSEMLEAVASGDDGIDVEDFATVEIGEVEVTVKAWMPGESMATIRRAQRLAERENLDAALDSIQTMADGMTVVTEEIRHDEIGAFTSDERIREFFMGMFNQWGVEGFQRAAERVIEPASEDMESKTEAVDGFRQNK